MDQQFPYQTPVHGAVFAPGRHHVSKAYLALQVIGTIIPILVSIAVVVLSAGVPLGAVLAAGEQYLGILTLVGVVIGVTILIMGLTVIVILLTWKNLEYQLTAKEFSLYSGIVFKKRMHVPYQKIQSVNQSAGVFKRIFGLCDLEIDTAGGSDNTAIRIPCLKTVDAEILRTEIFRRKNVLLSGGSIDETGCVFMPDQRMGPVDIVPTGITNALDAANSVWSGIRETRGDAFIDTGRVLFERGLSNLELTWASVSGSTVLLRTTIGFFVLGAIGLTEFLDVLLGSVFVEQLAMSSIDFTHMGASLIFGQFVLPILLALVGLLLLVWLVSVGVTAISYGGFRVRRRETRIEVEHGLLRHVFKGVDVDRVQSIIITQTFFRRIFGYCEVSLGKIDSLSADSSNSRRVNETKFLVHPCIKVSKVDELLAGVLPEYKQQPKEFCRPPKVALRRAVTRWVFLWSFSFWVFLITAVIHITVAMGIWTPVIKSDDAIFLATLMTGYLPFVYLLCALIMVKNTVKAWLWHRESGIAYNKNFMRIRTGGYTVVDVIFPRCKIQYGYTKSNPFQRHTHVETVCARLASGTGQTMSLLDVSEQDANLWLKWVRPRI